MARGGSYGPGRIAGIEEEKKRQEKIRRRERKEGNIITTIVAVLGAIGTIAGYLAGNGNKKR